MSKYHYDHIWGNPKFHELVGRKSKLSWTLAALMMVVYYSYILVIAFFPEWLGEPLTATSTTSWGIVVGIGIILFTFIVTGIYVHRANNVYDALMQKIVDDSYAHVNKTQYPRNKNSSQTS